MSTVFCCCCCCCCMRVCVCVCVRFLMKPFLNSFAILFSIRFFLFYLQPNEAVIAFSITCCCLLHIYIMYAPMFQIALQDSI